MGPFMNAAVHAVPSRQDIAKAWEDRTSKMHLFLLVCLLGILYGPVLSRLASQWSHDPNFSHGFFVPAFSLYVLWQERVRLSSLCPRPTWTGLGFVIPGLLCLVVGTLGAELFLSRVSIV